MLKRLRVPAKRSHSQSQEATGKVQIINLQQHKNVEGRKRDRILLLVSVVRQLMPPFCFPLYLPALKFFVHQSEDEGRATSDPSDFLWLCAYTMSFG